MKIQEALDETKARLKNLSPTPELDAEVLLSYVLDTSKAYLFSHPNQKLNENQLEKLNALTQERASGKPIAYITHLKEFFGRNFYVDERVLIPRPETEELVELALEYLKHHPEVKTVLDVGTGSGCIGITMALECLGLRVYGMDNSRDALEIAKKNTLMNGCTNIQFFQSDLLKNPPSTLNTQPLTILANLPYIGTRTFSEVEANVKAYEPHQALFAGNDGLDLYRKLWKHIQEKQLNCRTLFMEIAPGQEEIIKKQAPSYFPHHDIRVHLDLSRQARFVSIIEKEVSD